MKLLNLLLVALFWVPVSAWAGSAQEFHGMWVGKGTYIYDGRISNCPEFRMEFSGSAEKFKFAGGGRECEFHRETFEMAEMEIRGDELYFYGQKVGEFRENELSSEFRAPEEGGKFRNWRMFMRRQGNHLMYEESRRMDGETTPLISFSGLMILQSR
jgi:hypothetical protein